MKARLGVVGPGYDLDLPSLYPFMYVERHETRGDLGVIAFGAYNAFGLIGPEKGGVAVVLEKPNKAVLATRDIPYNPVGRNIEVMRILKLIGEFSGGRKSITMSRRSAFMDILAESGYDVRSR